MKIPFSHLAAVSLFVFLFNSCDKKPPESSATADPKPTRDTAVALLTDFAQKLESDDHDAAAKMLRAPSGVEPAQIKKALSRFIPQKEISSAGVKILAEKGKWGKLTEIFPDRGAKMAEKMGADPQSCWALSLDSAEAAFYWADDQFYIIRCDDIGKLGSTAATTMERSAPQSLPKKLTPQEKLEQKNYYTPENLRAANEIIANMTPVTREFVITAMKNRKKIQAVKAVRADHESSLAISKLITELISIKEGIDPLI